MIKLLQERVFIPVSFAVLAVLLSYQNTMLSNTFIPYNLFSDVYEGLIDPAEAYAERIRAGAADVKRASSYRRTINILSLLFALNYTLSFLFATFGGF